MKSFNYCQNKLTNYEMEAGIRLISVVVPCYNESSCINQFYDVITEVFAKYQDYQYELIFVNDGSKDNTADLLWDLKKQDGHVKIVDFSRNFGKEAALTAGLRASAGDVVVPIDADLQHPPEVIFALLERYLEGDVDVVVALRKSRDIESWLYKKLTRCFYKIENAISECEMMPDAGDFRLMSREVADVLSNMPESRRFMKGLYAWVGYKVATIPYEVAERVSGESKFSATRLLALATNGLLDFSSFPLRMWMLLGGFVSLISFIYGLWIVIRTVFWGVDFPGYASILCAILFLGGVQLISIGVLGEYIGRSYSEIKGRPAYIVRKTSSVKRK